MLLPMSIKPSNGLRAEMDSVLAVAFTPVLIALGYAIRAICTLVKIFFKRPIASRAGERNEAGPAVVAEFFSRFLESEARWHLAHLLLAVAFLGLYLFVLAFIGNSFWT